MDGKRTKRYTIRFTETENEKMLSDMDSHDYLSVAKYIRDLVLNHRVKIEKVQVTDRSLRNQINAISLKISKLGNNYNQIVHKYNYITTVKNKKGEYIVSSRATARYLTDLEKIAIEIRDLQLQLIEIVGSIKTSFEEGPQS